METLSFPRYNVAELVVHIRNKLLTGADGKDFSVYFMYAFYLIYVHCFCLQAHQESAMAPNTDGCESPYGCWELNTGSL